MGDFMHQLMGHSLCARPESESGDELAASVTSHPQPGRFGGSSQLQAQFIELHMGELQGTHQLIVQAVRMLAGARDPTPDRGFRHLEDAGRGLGTQAFGNSVQDLGDAGRGCFQVIEWGVASSSEFTLTGLTEKILDGVVSAVVSVADEGMDRGISVIEVATTRMWTSETSRVD